MIHIPDYRENAERALDWCRRKRRDGASAVSKVPEARFLELMAYAETMIAEAKELEAEAAAEPYPETPPGIPSWEAPAPPTVERYQARIDAARRAIDTIRYEPLINAAWRQSEAQAKRRKDKPGTDALDDVSRNDRIRAMHDRLHRAGSRDATAQVAGEFGLSASQVRRIVRRA